MKLHSRYSLLNGKISSILKITKRQTQSDEEAVKTAEQNKIKPDLILKNFWRDNHHFADLFNAAVFNGEEILKAEDLKEVDTDVSSLIKFNNHAETVQKVLDVVKKTANGVDFVVWGLENQEKIHYAMPLRHLIGDAFSYLKEYQEISAKNQKDKKWETSDEFLSNMKKTDRLHPMITLCVYYGEKEWDGPLSLVDMLEVPEYLKPLISDYKMNLLQLRKSEGINFRNKDVNAVFEITRSIYKREYAKIDEMYRGDEVTAEVGMVIGAITESKKLIQQALESREKGGMNMCTALDELMQEGIQKGMQQGIQQGMQQGREEGREEGRQEGEIIGMIKGYKKFNASREALLEELQKEFALSEEKAEEYLKEYW